MMTPIPSSETSKEHSSSFKDHLDLVALINSIFETKSFPAAVAEVVMRASQDPLLLAAIVTDYLRIVGPSEDDLQDHSHSLPPPTPRRHFRIVAPTSPSSIELQASRRAHQKIAANMMDVLRIDRRAIGDWTVGECQSAAVGKFREAYILRDIGRRFINVDPKKRVRDVLEVKDLHQIIKDAGNSTGIAFSN